MAMGTNNFGPLQSAHSITCIRDLGQLINYMYMYKVRMCHIKSMNLTWVLKSYGELGTVIECLGILCIKVLEKSLNFTVF